MQVNLTRKEKASLLLKRFFGAIYWNIPGPILTIKGARENYTVYRSLWVKVWDGQSEDWMPLTLCAQPFVDKVQAKLEQHWFIRYLKLTDRQQAFVNSQQKVEQPA